METKRWHKAYSKQKYHPFLSEKKAREKRMKTMGLFDLGKDAMILDVGCGAGIFEIAFTHWLKFLPSLLVRR